jgi:hypothetical protein
MARRKDEISHRAEEAIRHEALPLYESLTELLAPGSTGSKAESRSAR